MWNSFYLFFFESQLAFGRVARESTTTVSPIIDTLNSAYDLAKTFIDGAHNATLNLAGVKSDDEFWAKAKAQFTTYENTLRSSISDLDTEVSLTLFIFCWTPN